MSQLTDEQIDEILVTIGRIHDGPLFELRPELDKTTPVWVKARQQVREAIEAAAKDSQQSEARKRAEEHL